MNARFAILLFFGWLCAPLHAQTEDYAIDWFSLDCGGGTSADDLYSVSGTVGQFDAGELSDEVDSVSGGFWAATLDAEPPVVPVLNITRAGSNLILSWSAAATGFSLEATTDLFQSGGWHPVNQPVVAVNGQNIVTVPASDHFVFYRLTDRPSLPRLTIVRSGANVILSWPGSATGYFLEQNFDATQPYGWSLVGIPVVVSNAQNTVTLPAARGMAFFRLTQTPSQPALAITRSGNNVILSWPASATGYVLEQNLDATQPDGWSLVTLPVVVVNGRNTVTVPVSGRSLFYRLTDRPNALRLKITRSGANVILSWPALATGYFLERNLNATQPYGWSLVGIPVVVSNAQNTVTLPVVGGMAFFRLTQTSVPLALTIVHSGNNVILSWPASATGYVLEQNLDATQPDGWSLVTLPIVVVNGRNTVTVPVSERSLFYRLTDKPSALRLKIIRSGAKVILAWPASATGYFLERKSDATHPGGWSLVELPVVVSNAQNTVTLPVASGMAFFRLTQTPTPLRLTIIRSGNKVSLSWPASATGYFLQQNLFVMQTGGWALVNSPVAVSNNLNTVTVPISGNRAFFRLTQTLSPLALEIAR